jgi:hypothetical protein
MLYQARGLSMASDLKLSEQLRDAILNSSASRYRISAACGVREEVLSRFVNGTAGLSLGSIDRLGLCLGIRLVVDNPKADIEILTPSGRKRRQATQ